jgi:hypothetical protein
MSYLSCSLEVFYSARLKYVPNQGFCILKGTHDTVYNQGLTLFNQVWPLLIFEWPPVY